MPLATTALTNLARNSQDATVRAVPATHDHRPGGLSGFKPRSIPELSVSTARV